MAEPDEKLFEYLFIISRFIRGEVAADLKRQHLTMLQLQALVLIRERREVQMQEIAEYFKVTKPTATSLLNNLDKLGLVKRSGDTNDRRVVKVMLSGEGERLFKKVLRYKQEKIKTLLSYLSQQEKADLIKVAGALAKKLSDKIG